VEPAAKRGERFVEAEEEPSPLIPEAEGAQAPAEVGDAAGQ
jgi:hypothetical protein